MYCFDKTVSRAGTSSVKWDFRKEVFGTEDILPMWVADMDFEIAPEIRDALIKAADFGIVGYTGKRKEFYNAVQNWMKHEFNWEIKHEHIISTPGIVTALNIAVNAFTKEGDKVLVQNPVYYPFMNAVTQNKRILITNYLIEEDNYYTIDFENLEQQISEDVKMFILCSPHNPVGRVWTKEEIQRIINLCRKYNVLLLSDEIHQDLVYTKHYATAAVDPAFSDRIITCTAPSKTFNVPGLCSSAIIISNDKLRERFNEVIDRWGLLLGNYFGTVGHTASYNFGKPWLEELKVYLRKNIEFAAKYIEKKIPVISMKIPEGTYLLWLNCKKMNMTDEELKKFFIEDAKVGLDAGVKFGSNGTGFFRMNIAAPRSVVEEGLNRIHEAMKRKNII